MSFKENIRHAYLPALATFVGSVVYTGITAVSDQVLERPLIGEHLTTQYSPREIRETAQVIAGFYNPHELMAARKVNDVTHRNPWQNDSTYVYTFKNTRYDEQYSVNLRSVVDSAANHHKSTIVFNDSTLPLQGYQLSVKTAQSLVEKQERLQRDLKLEDNIPLLITSKILPDLSSTCSPSIIGSDKRQTEMTLGYLSDRPVDGMDFALSHEMGHHKFAAEHGGMWRGLASHLGDMLTYVSAKLTGSEPEANPDSFSSTRSHELYADSIGAKYSNFHSAAKALTSEYFSNGRNDMPSTDEVLLEFQKEKTFCSEISTHPADELRLQKIYRQLKNNPNN